MAKANPGKAKARPDTRIKAGAKSGVELSDAQLQKAVGGRKAGEGQKDFFP